MNNYKCENIAIAVTFFYVESRLVYLENTCSDFENFADEVSVYIVTNANHDEQEQITKRLSKYNFKLDFCIPTNLGHPFLLPWAHFSVFKNLFYNSERETHFLYVEDDIKIQLNNIEYWLNGREELRNYKFFPSFLRYELKNNDNTKYSTDVIFKQDWNKTPMIIINDNYAYINLKYPYQGTYLLDRELMEEHLNGCTSSPDFGIWHIREKAAQGLTFGNVPKGFFSRNLVGFNRQSFQIDSNCLIHHLPNNYALYEKTRYGKLPYLDIITRKTEN